MAIQSDLIFDIGAHLGEDTAYYLRRGYRVVAVEAEPRHVAQLRRRFAADIAAGRVVLVDQAIAEHEVMIRFFRNLNVSVWGTVNPAWAERNVGFGSKIEEITVPAITPARLFEHFGIPYYLKIDVEGLDMLVLRGLHNFEDRPSYVSIESDATSFALLKQEFDLLQALGYDDFKLSPQHRVQKMRVPAGSPHGLQCDYRFEEHSSGPFGEDVEGQWLNVREAIAEYKYVFALYDMFHAIEKGILSGSITAFRDAYGHDAGGWNDTHARHRSARPKP